MAGSTSRPATTDEGADAEPSVSAATGQRGIERELSHEEFDPKGTLTLILLYFVVLTVMWVFMYFFEFLGNEMVVVG